MAAALVDMDLAVRWDFLVCVSRMIETWPGCTHKFDVEFLFEVQKYNRPKNDGREMVVIRLTFVEV